MLSKCKAWGEGYVVPVDLQELLAGSHSEDLMAAIEIQPLEGLASISAAIHEVTVFSMSLQGSRKVQGRGMRYCKPCTVHPHIYPLWW